MKICNVNDCDKVVHCKGLCNKHYRVVLKAAKPGNICGCGCGERTLFTFKWGHHTRLFTNAEQSRRGSMQTGDALRGTGLGLTYTKRMGRHEHRVVAEQTLGRALLVGEIVHHVDGNHKNNRPENLEVMTKAAHTRLHALEYWARVKGAQHD